MILQFIEKNKIYRKDEMIFIDLQYINILNKDLEKLSNILIIYKLYGVEDECKDFDYYISPFFCLLSYPPILKSYFLKILKLKLLNYY